MVQWFNQVAMQVEGLFGIPSTHVKSNESEGQPVACGPTPQVAKMGSLEPAG